MSDLKGSGIVNSSAAGSVIFLGDYKFAQDLSDAGKESLSFYFSEAFRNYTKLMDIISVTLCPNCYWGTVKTLL